MVKGKLQQPHWRFGHLTARILPQGYPAVEVLLLNIKEGGGLIITVPLSGKELSYPSLTAEIPAAHRAERAIGDFFGIRAQGHPHWQTLILNSEAWPADFTPLSPTGLGQREPFAFTEVVGEGIHEIPVGPIHAGIIEPGHFRFSCVGEIIVHLDIRLGYQHRGIEKRLSEMPWPHTRFLAESASSDTASGHALAHAIAMENLLEITPPPRAQYLRTMALEIERLANHIGDLGAMAGDIGYSAGAGLFSQGRGAVLALAQTLSGNRRQRYYIKPGGVNRDLTETGRQSLALGIRNLSQQMKELIPLLLENPAVIDRMEGVGHLTPKMAKDLGIVGPAGRASASHYDARASFAHGLYPAYTAVIPHRETGDVLARAQIKTEEILSSLDIIAHLLEKLPQGPIAVKPLEDKLPGDRVGIGIVEAWRGELIHWITTSPQGKISRYAVKDPSFNNWKGLGIAMRGNLVADFPLCNKSFNLSYSGSDL